MVAMELLLEKLFCIQLCGHTMPFAAINKKIEPSDMINQKLHTRVNNKAIYLSNRNAYTVYTVHTTV